MLMVSTSGSVTDHDGYELSVAGNAIRNIGVSAD